jgi:hypothetical protein
VATAAEVCILDFPNLSPRSCAKKKKALFFKRRRLALLLRRRSGTLCVTFEN